MGNKIIYRGFLKKNKKKIVCGTILNKIKCYICECYFNNLMNKHLKILIIIALLGGFAYSSFADRGVGKKKNKVTLNISTSEGNFQNNLAFNLKTGLKYNGSLLAQPSSSIQIPYNQLITYRKGNSVYIVPFKQRVLVTDSRPGYAGVKLIISTP